MTVLLAHGIPSKDMILVHHLIGYRTIAIKDMQDTVSVTTFLQQQLVRKHDQALSASVGQVLNPLQNS